MTEIIQVNRSHQGIILSETAKAHILTWLNKERASNTEGIIAGVRFSLKKTGCSGWSYVVEPVITPNESDQVQPFVDSYQIFLDKKSYPFLRGTSVDYQKVGLGFKFTFDNPNQTGQCGCGESFSVD